MKVTALEEYGLRCLLQLAKAYLEHEEGSLTQVGLSISEIAKREGLSIQYVSKITSQLRKAGLISSMRGVHGGYHLTKKPHELKLLEVSKALGNSIFNKEFCMDHSGQKMTCVHEKNCSVRSVWSGIHQHINTILSQVSLADLLNGEMKTDQQLLRVISG